MVKYKWCNYYFNTRFLKSKNPETKHIYVDFWVFYVFALLTTSTLAFSLLLSVWMQCARCRAWPVWMKQITQLVSCSNSQTSARSGSFTCPNCFTTFRQGTWAETLPQLLWCSKFIQYSFLSPVCRLTCVICARLARICCTARRCFIITSRSEVFSSFSAVKRWCTQWENY